MNHQTRIQTGIQTGIQTRIAPLNQPPPNLELQIERVVLQGFAASDRYRIGEAMQQELIRLFREEGIPPGLQQNQETPHLNATIYLAPTAPPEAIGHQIAQAIYTGFRP